MKTKTIIAYRLTTDHKLIIRDLDGTRRVRDITRIQRGRGIHTGKPIITVFFHDQFGSETPVVFRPRDKAEIPVES